MAIDALAILLIDDVEWTRNLPGIVKDEHGVACRGREEKRVTGGGHEREEQQKEKTHDAHGGGETLRGDAWISVLFFPLLFF